MAQLNLLISKNYNSNLFENTVKNLPHKHTSESFGDKGDIHKQKNISVDNNQKIIQTMFASAFQTTITPKGIKEIPVEVLANLIQKKNMDTISTPIANNILSPQQIINLGFDKDFQKFNTRHFKEALSFFKDTGLIDDDDEEELKDDENCIGNIATSSLFGTTPVKSDIQDAKLSNHHMSFASSHTENKPKWLNMNDENQKSHLLTFDLSKKCLEFIKKNGHKDYYNDIYSRFHTDDIIKTAYILDDAKLYDYLSKTGQITPEELKKLPILGRNQTPESAHYNTLITPEFMGQFLSSQKLINVHIYDDFINIFHDRQWFHTGAMQLLMQIIGGEYIIADEISFFMEWYADNTEEFNQLFDFFDIEGDYSVSRNRETENMRSKHITSDSIKVAHLKGAFDTLTSANDPLPNDFFVLDFEKTVKNGFYNGLSYMDYLGLHGIDADTIFKRTTFKPKKSMITEDISQNTDYLLDSII